MLAGRARVAERYREALAGIEGLSLPCPDAGGDRRGWFVFVVQVPRDGPSRDAVVRALRERAIQSKPYLPAIHLMSLLPRAVRPSRGRVPGLRGRRRALARAAVLPGDDRRAGRAGRRGAAAGPRARLDSPSMSRFAEPQDPDFASINRSLDVDRRLWPYDVAQSRAHARMLAAQGIIGDDGPRRADRRARRGRGGAARRHVPVPAGRRGHPHGRRAAPDRAGRPGRRQAPHRALAQRPGRHRRRAVRARGRRGRWPSASRT